jgi:ABC-2 type transport system permease protein
LLRAERSLIVVAPMVMFLCGLELAAYSITPEGSYSATYAGRTANLLLLFHFGVAVFYRGETMRRDRELRVEPVLWSAPAPNSLLLLSKFSATLLLSISLVTLVGLTAAGVQIYQGHAPLELRIYITTYAVIPVPSLIFMPATSAALNVLLRDKYLAYTAGLAIGGGGQLGAFWFIGFTASPSRAYFWRWRFSSSSAKRRKGCRLRAG